MLLALVCLIVIIEVANCYPAADPEAEADPFLLGALAFRAGQRRGYGGNGREGGYGRRHGYGGYGYGR